ncbi:MAG: GatB/YqeY domain-containing protein [Woeseiaceae bacterium]|nr:GatB/YqeY domain-containing protein [Woeseiaceae bacterium]
MKLKHRIREEMKDAMRSGERERLKVIRLIISSVKQVEIDTRQGIDNDGQVLEIINKMVKQRRDSVKQFLAGSRQDLVDIELSEIEILENYLPEQLNAEEIELMIDSAMTETAATDMKDMGKVMAATKAKINGRADMSTVSQQVRSRLSK